MVLFDSTQSYRAKKAFESEGWGSTIAALTPHKDPHG